MKQRSNSGTKSCTPFGPRHPESYLAYLLVPILTTSSAYAGMITTLFAGNVNLTNGGIVYFDAEVLNPAGLEFVGLDVNTDAAVGNLVGIHAYLTPGTRVGNEGNAAAWTLVSAGFGTGAGVDMPTLITLIPFDLAPGSYGIAIVLTDLTSGTDGHRYTVGDGSNENYANADIALELGASEATPFAGAILTPRVWNGTIYYNVIGDIDNDGFGGANDNCPSTPNPGQEDTDMDGAGNACDDCPEHPGKTAAGQCGCGAPETDTDGNGTPDCLDVPPPPAAGCCAPGVFPVMGLFMPMVLLGWKWTRWSSRVH